MKYSNNILFIYLFMNLVIGQTGQRDYNEELRYQNDSINKMKKEIEELS